MAEASGSVGRLSQALSEYVGYFDMSEGDRKALVAAIIARMNELNLPPDEQIEIGADPYDGHGSGFRQFDDDTTDTDDTITLAGSGTVTAPDFSRILQAGSQFLAGGPDPRRSQLGQFQGVLGADPFAQSISPTFQRSLESQFDPLAASFALQTALSPFGPNFSIGGGGFQSPQSFQGFLGGGQAQPLSTGQFEQGFGALSPFFGPEGFTPPQQGGPGQLQALKFLAQQPIAENIISQYAQGQVAPIFQRLLAQDMQDAFSAFNLTPQAGQPGGLFGQFLRGGVGGFGGGFGV
jgi:hypothetical protein